jgi:hypothetical protein
MAEFQVIPWSENSHQFRAAFLGCCGVGLTATILCRKKWGGVLVAISIFILMTFVPVFDPARFDAERRAAVRNNLSKCPRCRSGDVDVFRQLGSQPAWEGDTPIAPAKATERTFVGRCLNCGHGWPIMEKQK